MLKRAACCNVNTPDGALAYCRARQGVLAIAVYRAAGILVSPLNLGGQCVVMEALLCHDGLRLPNPLFRYSNNLCTTPGARGRLLNGIQKPFALAIDLIISLGGYISRNCIALLSGEVLVRHYPQSSCGKVMHLDVFVIDAQTVDCSQGSQAIKDDSHLQRSTLGRAMPFASQQPLVVHLMPNNTHGI